MISIDNLIIILNDSPLSFKFAILAGIILLIIAAVPTMSVLIFKSQALALTRNQSIILGLVGSALILGGLTGLVALAQVSNASPLIVSVDYPLTTTAFKSGTPVKISVTAKDPDINSVQKIFAKIVPLQYEFFLIGPGTNNSIERMQGPAINNTCTWWVTPHYAGENMIIINVTDRPPGEKDTKFTSSSYRIQVQLPNQLPKIEEISPNDKTPRHVGERIKITAKATDPENDKIYYQFFRYSPPPAQSFSEIAPNWMGQTNERYWVPNASDIGENIIIAYIRDGDKYGPFWDHENVTADWPIYITGTNT
jgi:hypothetical protein